MLVKKIENCRNFINGFQEKKIELIHLLEDAKRTEVINSFGISNNSQISIRIIQAEDLKDSQGFEPYVIVNCGQNRAQTKISSNKIFYWDELLILYNFYLNFK